MKQGKSSSISFTEAALKGKTILSQQPEISYAQALAQVQRLKKISSVSPQLMKISSPKIILSMSLSH